MRHTPKLVRVIWTDPDSNAGWETIQNVVNHKPAKVLSVGFLLAFSTDYLTLAHTLSNGESDRETIPIACVHSIEPICCTKDLDDLLALAEPHLNFPDET